MRGKEWGTNFFDYYFYHGAIKQNVEKLDDSCSSYCIPLVLTTGDITLLSNYLLLICNNILLHTMSCACLFSRSACVQLRQRHERIEQVLATISLPASPQPGDRGQRTDKFDARICWLPRCQEYWPIH